MTANFFENFHVIDEKNLAMNKGEAKGLNMNWTVVGMTNK